MALCNYIFYCLGIIIDVPPVVSVHEEACMVVGCCKFAKEIFSEVHRSIIEGEGNLGLIVTTARDS